MNDDRHLVAGRSKPPGELIGPRNDAAARLWPKDVGNQDNSQWQLYADELDLRAM
jgi:hypothetical protein